MPEKEVSQPTHGELLKLWECCEAFINEQHIRSPDSVNQMDNVIENAYTFIEDVCEIVGYFSDDE